MVDEVPLAIPGAGHPPALDAGHPPALDTVEEAHRALLELIEQLKQVGTLQAALDLLCRLDNQLNAHFAVEEAPGGLLDSIRPHHPRVVGALHTEHLALRAELRVVMDNTRACLAGPVAQVLAQVGELATSLQEHEEREAEQLTELLYTDLGEGG